MASPKPAFEQRICKIICLSVDPVDDQAELPDLESDMARVQRPEWLVVVGICTHLGCVPLGQGSNNRRGEYGGWFCTCHGSHYDTSGRFRRGSAPKNLNIPPYRFLSDSRIEVG